MTDTQKQTERREGEKTGQTTAGHSDKTAVTQADQGQDSVRNAPTNGQNQQTGAKQTEARADRAGTEETRRPAK